MTDGNRLELAGGTGSRRLPVPHEVAAQVERALRQYEAEVDSSRLQPTTKRTYKLHANSFVRWLRGDFIPGGTL